MKLSETYQAAIDVINERGWIQAGADGDYDPWGRDGGAVCIEGALMAVVGDYGTRPHTNEGDYEGFCECPVYRDMVDYLGLRSNRLYNWNDATERTQEQVIEALEGARDRALEREGIAQAHAELQREFDFELVAA